MKVTLVILFLLLIFFCQNADGDKENLVPRKVRKSLKKIKTAGSVAAVKVDLPPLQSISNVNLMRPDSKSGNNTTFFVSNQQSYLLFFSFHRYVKYN